MVRGLEKFKEYFKDYTNQYVFIGGTACDILMNESGVSFGRTTKDLDIVLIVEALDEEFFNKFYQFIEDGGYEHRQKSGKNQFYRFTEPKDDEYPKMIELFSRGSTQVQLNNEARITPITIDESIISLSAILLNNEYYQLLISGKTEIDGFSLIEPETVILFKMKAWLDNKEKKENGKQVRSNDIRKHKNDVFRLLAIVNPSMRIDIPEEIENDVRSFLKQIDEDRPDLRNLDIDGTFEEMIELIENIYLKTP